MSITNDADYPSRLRSAIPSSSASTLAGNLLSRKRKRDTETPPAKPRPKTDLSLIKSLSESSLPLDESFSRSSLPLDESFSRSSLPLDESFSRSSLPRDKSFSRPSLPPNKSLAQSSIPPALVRQKLPPPLPQTFVIRSVDNDKPISFRILTTIHRARLPLSCVDRSDSPTRLFLAHLPHLDRDASSAPLVLITRQHSPPSEVLCAVERVGHNKYALCKLAAWLTLERIDAMITPRPQHLSLTKPTFYPADASWWQSCVLDTPHVISQTSRKAPRLSLCLLDDGAVDVPELDFTQSSTQAAEQVCESADDILGRFISQYLDTLYLSKTPLAFFAKGPLSRLRAAFTSGHVQGTSLPDLVSFLRSLIVSSSAADRKYRDKLPELLKDLPSQIPDHDDTTAAKKKRRKKKLKPDKAGLLPEEADFFAKWWFQDDNPVPADETAEQSLRRRVPQLRTRESFMQVILLLEILSLETLPEFKSVQEQAVPAKSKKNDTVTLSLELLVDKLCIWHSVHTADLLGEAPQPDKATKDDANQLHNFCVHVIIPFYMSRAQEHASFVNNKLGGPTTSSTSKPKHSRKVSELDSTTTADKKPRRSLARVATVSLPQSSRPPRSFSRSATDLQVIKRETPELSLSSIPARRDSQPAMARKNEVLEKHRLRQREVDFGAIAAANDAKAKRKQEVEQKLRDAISTLKKPSRAVVSGEFVDALEQRKRMAEGRARPPLSKRTSSTAQVAATPKHAQKHSAVAATPHRIPGPSFTQPLAPSSGPSLVPSSNIKQKSLSFAHFPSDHPDSDEDDAIPATDNRPRHRDALAETPMKPRVEFASLPRPSMVTTEIQSNHVAQDRGDSSPLRESPTLLKTPSKPQRPRFSITPSKPTPPLDFGQGKPNQRAIATPLKVAVANSPPKTLGGSAATEKLTGAKQYQPQRQASDIYAALGWDDDDDFDD